jgi:hypothetical protein
MLAKKSRPILFALLALSAKAMIASDSTTEDNELESIHDIIPSNFLLENQPANNDIQDMLVLLLHTIRRFMSAAPSAWRMVLDHSIRSISPLDSSREEQKVATSTFWCFLRLGES